MYWSAIDMFQTADYWNRKWIVGKYVCVCVCARAYKRVGISYMYVSVLYPRIWDVGLVCRVVFTRLYIYIYCCGFAHTSRTHSHTIVSCQPQSGACSVLMAELADIKRRLIRFLMKFEWCLFSIKYGCFCIVVLIATPDGTKVHIIKLSFYYLKVT